MKLYVSFLGHLQLDLVVNHRDNDNSVSIVLFVVSVLQLVFLIFCLSISVVA